MRTGRKSCDKNYNWDKEDGYWVSDDTNLYASYIFKPNDKSLSIFDKITLHGRDYIGDFLDGRTKELPVKSFPSYQRGIILENIMLTVESKHKL